MDARIRVSADAIRIIELPQEDPERNAALVLARRVVELARQQTARQDCTA
jgi:hypothetical protein